MGKNQSASNLTNIIQYNNGNITFVSGSTTLMSISSSGAITTTGVISGSNALSASYAANADTLDGLNSTAFATTGAYSDTSGSLYTVSSSAYATSGSLSTASGSLSAASGSLSATSGSLSAASGSFNTRVSALEITGSALSSSILSVSSSAYATSGSLSTASGSFNSRVATIESKYATTGSNTFIGTQVISGSILQSGSFTTTGTIIAQTINVQSVTSSVVYSSGSNVFGNSLGNSQTFTGSVLITGSLTIAGASSATSYSGATIYGSTAVCSPVGKFTSCIDAGSGIFSGALNGTSATFSGLITSTAASDILSALSSNTAYKWINLANTGGNLVVGINNSAGGATMATAAYASYIFTRTATDLVFGTNDVVRFTIASTGAATFACNVQATTLSVGGTATADQLSINNGTSNQYATLRLAGSNRGGQINFYNQSYPTAQILVDQSGNIDFLTGVFAGASVSTKFSIANTGGACFACCITAPGLQINSPTYVPLVINSSYGQVGANFSLNGTTFGGMGSANNFSSDAGINPTDMGMGTNGTSTGKIVFATGTGYTTRMIITSAGVTCFSSTVCSPVLIISNSGTACTITDVLTLANTQSGGSSVCAGTGLLFTGNNGATVARIYSRGNMNFNNGSDLVFQTQTSAGGGPQCTMVINGNSQSVGIGTFTPNETLDVNGTIQVRGSSAGYATTQCVTQLDFYAGAARILSFGGNATTCGCFRFYSAAQNNAGGSDVATISGGGAACFAGQICAPSLMITDSVKFGTITAGTPAQFSFNSTVGTQTTANITDSGNRCGILEIIAQGGAAGQGSGIILGADTWGGGNGRGQIAIKALLINGSGCGTSDMAFSLRNTPTCSNFTERMRITVDGNLGVGTGGPSAKLHVYSNTSCVTAPTVFLHQFDGNGQGYGQIVSADKNHGLIMRGTPTSYLNFGVAAGDQMSFFEYGDDFRFYRKTDANDMQVQVQFSGGVIYARNTTVQALSDIRTKENIRSSEEGLNIITRLRPVRFDFKEGYSDGKKNQLGFIAQEVEEIFPDAVSEMKDNAEIEGERLKTVGPGALIPVLVKAIQEQQCTINTLKTCLGIA